MTPGEKIFEKWYNKTAKNCDYFIGKWEDNLKTGLPVLNFCIKFFYNFYWKIMKKVEIFLKENTK